MFRHLLVPTDGSDLSDGTIRRAVDFARDAGARITFFHAKQSVLSHSDLALYGEPLVLDPSVVEQFARAEDDHAEALLADARAIAEREGVSCDTDCGGNPIVYEGIVEAAERHGCDLIFMASHGRRGLAGFLLGSETQRVLTHSPLPVLVFRRPEGSSPS
jgi:nucleotide-binding universal stress UspA family protein